MSTNDDIYSQLIVINHEAFDEGDYETACHALAAALDRARFLRNQERLAEVGGIATNQLDCLDHHPPTDVFPTRKQARRTTLHTLFTALAREASLMIDITRHEQRLQQHERMGGELGDRSSQEPITSHDA